MQKSYSDYINKIDKFKKEIKENKDEVISNLAKLKNITNHPPLKYPIVALNMMIQCRKQLHLIHCVKYVRIRSFPGPYFPAFGLNTEIQLQHN